MIISFQNKVSLYQLKDSFSETITFTYSHIYGKFHTQSQKLYNAQFFQERLPTYFQEDSQLIKEMIQEVSSSQQNARYGDSEYKQFFYPILQSDICETLKQNPQYIPNAQYSIEDDFCENPKNTILKKGFQTSSSFFFSQLQQAYDFSNSLTPQNYQQSMQQWQDDFDIKNFHQFFTVIRNVISILKDFIEHQGTSYIDEMNLTEIIITTCQIGILIIVYYFGWISFYYRTSFQMNQTRRLLSLLDIYIIVENSYILSYLNRIK